MYEAASANAVLEVDGLETGKLDKCKDVSDFDEGYILMARKLGQSISSTAGLGVMAAESEGWSVWSKLAQELL